MSGKHFLCVECDEVVVHEEGNTCSVCMILLAEDDNTYDEPQIAVYKFR